MAGIRRPSCFYYIKYRNIHFLKHVIAAVMSNTTFIVITSPGILSQDALAAKNLLSISSISIPPFSMLPINVFLLKICRLFQIKLGTSVPSG